jgi:hypothetical protein
MRINFSTEPPTLRKPFHTKTDPWMAKTDPLSVMVLISKTDGLDLSVFPREAGVLGFFVKMLFAPPNQPAQKTRVCPRPPFDFDEEALTFQCTRKEIETAVLTIAFYAAAKPMSNLVAFVNIPGRICPRNHVVEGKFLFTCEPCFAENSVKCTVKLHVSEPRKGARPFGDTRKKISTDILKQFAKQTGAGAVSIGTHLPSFQTVAPGAFPVIKKEGKVSEFAAPDGGKAIAPPSGKPDKGAPAPPKPAPPPAPPPEAPPAKPKRPPPPNCVPPPLLLQAIETAIATAPAEMWAHFRDYEFLAEGLKFFRAPNPPPV